MKKEEYFKCKEHHHDAHEVASVAAEVNQLRSLMADKSGIDFKVIIGWYAFQRSPYTERNRRI